MDFNERWETLTERTDRIYFKFSSFKQRRYYHRKYVGIGALKNLRDNIFTHGEAQFWQRETVNENRIKEFEEAYNQKNNTKKRNRKKKKSVQIRIEKSPS